jgi:lactate permease
MFTQSLDPLGNAFLTFLAAISPVVLLLALLAVFRLTAWLAVLIGGVATFAIGALIWGMPVEDGATAFGLGMLNGAWSVDWITLWGVVLFNTLVLTGTFERFRLWLISVGTIDVRVQTMLFAWAFGALLEGLVGFGYPWAVIAPILIALGIPDLDAIRVAAIANNAPVSYGALGVPIVALATVTGLPLLELSASIGKVVAVLALLPPWILLYLVSGRRGMREGWPLAIVGSLGYIAGQFPVATWLGPYLPDVSGSMVAFGAILLLLKVWRPRTPLSYGGHEIPGGWAAAGAETTRFSGGEVFRAWLPFIVLIAVVVAWTGPWSDLPKVVWWLPGVSALDAVEHAKVAITFKFAPWAGGSAILTAWLIVALLLRVNLTQLGAIFAKTFRQMWGALLVGVFIFGLANVFNFSGMAGSLADGFAKLGPVFVVVAPILGWIGVALSGSNTSTNTMFGHFQMLVGKILGFPPLLLPTLNSVGAEIGKPVAPQTASVGVATSRFVRNEGEVIRHNMAWTFVLLAYLIVIGVGFYLFAPGLMMPKAPAP